MTPEQTNCIAQPSEVVDGYASRCARDQGSEPPGTLCRRPVTRWAAWVALAFIGVVAPGCEDDPDWELWFSDVSPPGEPQVSPEPPEFEFVQEFGELDEGLAFGRIVGVAVSEAGVLAVVDAADCRIWWIDTATGAYRTSGGCGEGPGEFREPVSAAFLGDTLVVLHNDHSGLIWLGPDGSEVARRGVPLGELGAMGITHVRSAPTGSLVLGLLLFPRHVTPTHDQVAVVGGTELEVKGLGVGTPLIWDAPDVQAVRGGSACVGGNAAKGMAVVAVSVWGPQLAAFEGAGLRERWSTRVPIPWAQPRVESTSGRRMPISPWPAAACGAEHAVIGYRSQRFSDGVTEVLAAAMVVVNLADGSMAVLGGDEPPPEGSLLFMSPMAATGNRYFFVTNGFFGHPVVREYRLVSGPEAR